MARIVVCGYMIRYPVVGMVMAYLHYVLGLRRLGHEVHYLEESGWPRSCYDPTRRSFSDDPTAGLAIVRNVAACYAGGELVPIRYVDRDSGATYGAEWRDVKALLRSADLLLNIGGVCWLPEFRLSARRALIDMDPFFTQIGQFAGDALTEHDVHFSYGANVGRPICSVPTARVDWIPTVPPVVVDIWSSADAASARADRFTTIANWSAYGATRHDGERYGQKDEEFLRLGDLPLRVGDTLEIAVSGIGDADRRRLLESGWSLREAAEVSEDAHRYREYVTGSLGEFSVAKNAYVKTRSGWFSDRSVCYLAAGRPVILQDTGFSARLPTGRGLLAFSTPDEAADRIEAVSADYATHRVAAARIAHDHFAHDVVLPRLLRQATGSTRHGLGATLHAGGLE